VSDAGKRGGLLAWVRRQLSEHAEKVRYLVVGVYNTAVSYLLFLLLLATVGAAFRTLSSSPVGLLALMGRNYYLLASWIGWVVAVPHSTITMKYLVFRKPGRLVPQIGRAFLIYLPAQGLGSVLLWSFVSLMHLHPAVGALLTIAITTVISYLGHKYFTFKTPLGVGEAPPENPSD
jgi:putative flippase GtrA